MDIKIIVPYPLRRLCCVVAWRKVAPCPLIAQAWYTVTVCPSMMCIFKFSYHARGTRMRGKRKERLWGRNIWYSLWVLEPTHHVLVQLVCQSLSILYTYLHMKGNAYQDFMLGGGCSAVCIIFVMYINYYWYVFLLLFLMNSETLIARQHFL